MPELIHGTSTAVRGDSLYQGKRELMHAFAPQDREKTYRRYRLILWLDPVERRKIRRKSRVRAKVAHPILVLKVISGFRRMGYRSVAANSQRLNVACALVVLFMQRRPFLRLEYGARR